MYKQKLLKKGKITKAQISDKLIQELRGSCNNSNSASILDMDKQTIMIEKDTDFVFINSKHDLRTETLLLYKNGVYLEQDFDYIINYEENKISRLDGEQWKCDEDDITSFNYIILKSNDELVNISKETIVRSKTFQSISVKQLDHRDNVMVFKNGIYLEEGVDYVLDKTDNKINHINSSWVLDQGDEIMFNLVYIIKSSSLVDLNIKKESFKFDEPVRKIPLQVYDRLKDDIMLFINGVYYEEGYDYIISSDNTIMRIDGSYFEVYDSDVRTAEVVYVSRIRQMIDTPTPSILSSTAITFKVNQWTKDVESDSYYVIANHGLLSMNVIVSMINEITFENMSLSYKVLDSSGIKVFVTQPADVIVTIVNANTTTVKEVPTESIFTLDIMDYEWMKLLSVDSDIVYNINHNLSTSNVMVSAYDLDTKMNLNLSYKVIDNNNIQIINTVANNCRIMITYKSVINNNPILQINDQVCSYSSTYSSEKIDERFDEIFKILSIINNSNCFDPRSTNDIKELNNSNLSKLFPRT